MDFHEVVLHYVHHLFLEIECSLSVRCLRDSPTRMGLEQVFNIGRFLTVSARIEINFKLYC